MIPILTFDMMGAATSSGLFESVVPRVALKLRPTRGPAQGVWSRAPARHYLWVRPDLFFSGEKEVWPHPKVVPSGRARPDALRRPAGGPQLKRDPRHHTLEQST